MEKWKNDHEISRKIEGGNKGVEYLNPISQKKFTSKKDNVSYSNKPIRQPRKDKRHNVKFPVTLEMSRRLKTYCKLASATYIKQGREPLTQTKFNNLLLRFGLNHLEIVRWGGKYKDTKTYMHTNLPENEYQDIGGPYGLAVQKQLSERKVVYFIINSVLEWIERRGTLEKII